MGKEEDKNRTAGLTVSLLIHALLLLIFIITLAWKEPNPPIPEYGIELSFGAQFEGSSSTKQSSSSASSSAQTSEQEVESQENNENTAPSEAPDTEADEINDTEVKSQESIIKEEASKSEPAQSGKVTPIENREVVKQEVNDKPSQSEQGKNIDNKGEENKDSPEKNSETNDKDGNDGSQPIDERALYGKNTGTSEKGSYLNMAGWSWDFKPAPDDTSSENGKIVFQITIDDRGDIVGIKTLQTTVTPAVEKIYRDEVFKLSFSPTSDNYAPAPSSKGEITFIIRSK